MVGSGAVPAGCPFPAGGHRPALSARDASRRGAGSGSAAMGIGDGLGLAAVLAAAVLCGTGGLAGRVLSGECAETGEAGRRIVSGVGAGAVVGLQR